MLLQEIIAYVNGRYVSNLTDTEMIEHINEIYSDLSRAFTKDTLEEEKISTVNGTELYTLPVSSRRIKEVHATISGKRVRLRSMRAEARLIPRTVGDPLRWYPYGFGDANGAVRQRFGVDPVPDNTVELHVLYEPVPDLLSLDDDALLYIPEEYQYIVSYGTIALLASNQEDWNVSQAWEARYRSAVNEMVMTLGIVPPNNYPDLSKMRKTVEG